MDPMWGPSGPSMAPYQDHTFIKKWSQLIQNCNISFEIFTNVSGGLWEAAGALRGRFGGGSGKVRGRFGGGSGNVRGSHGGASARTPCGHLYGTPIIPLLEPSSELAIKKYII